MDSDVQPLQKMIYKLLSHGPRRRRLDSSPVPPSIPWMETWSAPPPDKQSGGGGQSGTDYQCATSVIKLTSR